MADETERKEVVEDNNKKKKGILSRIWNGLFRLHGDDFEKRLQYISREEATIVARMKTRSSNWRRTARNLIIFSVFFEAVAVGYAIITTRSVDLDWRMRALRVLPMFLLPALSSALYSGLLSFTRMCERRDQRTLERLRAERQAKIDELKERTNYYTTQQLIQRYDPDPAAKAAAATVLATKLGADSGLKVFLGDESQLGKSNDIQLAQSSTGLRKRNPSDARSTGSDVTPHSDKEKEMMHVSGSSSPGQLVVEHHNPPTVSAQDGGWIARLAALLVGEDPTQSYAVICGNCHMHNGLARKEDFPFITYYCPHCHALNKPKNSEKPSPGAINADIRPSMIASTDVGLIKQSSQSVSPPTVSDSGNPVGTEVEEREASEKIVAEDPASHY